MIRSLNLRFLLSHLAVVIVCLLVAGLALLAALRLGQIEQRLVFQRLTDVGQVTSVALRGRDVEPGRASRLLQYLDETRDIRVMLLDAEGTVIFDTRGEWTQETVLRTAIYVRDEKGNLQGTYEDREEQTWTFVAIPRAGATETQHLAFATSQTGRLAAAWARENLLVPLLWAGLAALVLSTLLALVLGRSVAQPLTRVSAAAQALARGETDVRAPVSGPAEVRALARTFNAMADRVEAAQHAQRDFVANVSHEMKTPLTSIQGFSQALLDGTAAEPGRIKRAATVIHTEARRMRRLVDELLLLARFDAGQIQVASREVELHSLLRRCVEGLMPQAEAAGVDLRASSPDGLIIQGDFDALRRVFDNLLDNALAHTPPGGQVTLEAHIVDEDAVEVTVTDTGTGIPAEDIPRIFERFYRSDKARAAGGGAGLGLAIAREIVEAHRGIISVESVVGLGTRFTVRLPSAPPPSS